jgi:hypothetical protein
VFSGAVKIEIRETNQRETRIRINLLKLKFHLIIMLISYHNSNTSIVELVNVVNIVAECVQTFDPDHTSRHVLVELSAAVICDEILLGFDQGKLTVRFFHRFVESCYLEKCSIRKRK